jgi:hypothetical protein
MLHLLNGLTRNFLNNQIHLDGQVRGKKVHLKNMFMHHFKPIRSQFKTLISYKA